MTGRSWFATAPAAAFLAALFVAPFLVFAAYSVFESGFYDVSPAFTLEHYRDALSSPFARELAVNSLVNGGATGALSVAVALPVAFFMRFRAGRWEYVLLLLVLLAMVVSYLVRVYAWRTILGDEGLLNSALAGVGLPTVEGILFSRYAVVLALVHIFVPYVILVAYAALRNVPRDLLELSADLGAAPVTTWRRVVLPLVAPAALSAFFFVFVLSASDYVTPDFLGGKDGNMIGLLINQQFTQVGDFPMGAAISILMLALFLALYGALALGLRRLGLNQVASRF